MEPTRADGRPNRMLADTAAIRAFGAAQDRHAAELETITARLGEVRAQLPSDALGPVGARFLAALSEAVTREMQLIARVGEGVAAAAATAHATADAYVGTERDAAHAIAGFGGDA
jgi:L-rhamnose isomerase